MNRYTAEKPLASQQSSAMLEIWQNSALRAQTRIVCAEGWGLLIFDWFILSMRMQVILDSPFARPGSAPMWGAGRKETSGTGLQKIRSGERSRFLVLTK